MANYIVLEMDLNEKWWDKWFAVGGLSIDRSIKLHHYNYFSMSSVYLLTRGDIAKKTMKKSERLLVQIEHNWCDRRLWRTAI